jgi:hypothetical protein
MTHQATMPPLVRHYFDADDSYQRHPTAYATYSQTHGWRRLPYNKRLSQHWLRQMKTAGITQVQVRYQGRLADFAIDEMLRSYR